MPSTKHKIDAKWLRLNIGRKDYSLRAFARAMGIDPSGLQAILRGDRKVQLPEVETIARLLEQPVAEVLQRVGLKVDLGPAYPGGRGEVVHTDGQAPLGGTVDATTGEVKFSPTGESKDAAVVALAMIGDPFLESWRVLCAPGEVSARLEAGMDTAIVRTRDGRTLLRKIRPAFAPGRFDLGPVFGFGAREDGVEVVGIIPVRGMGR